MQVNSSRFNGITPIDTGRILSSPPHWIPRWSLRRIGDAWRYFSGFKVGVSLLYQHFFAICCGLSQVKGTLAFLWGGGSKISLWKICWWRPTVSSNFEKYFSVALVVCLWHTNILSWLPLSVHSAGRSCQSQATCFFKISCWFWNRLLI
jgi:hypothetical protein